MPDHNSGSWTAWTGSTVDTSKIGPHQRRLHRRRWRDRCENHPWLDGILRRDSSLVYSTSLHVVPENPPEREPKDPQGWSLKTGDGHFKDIQKSTWVGSICSAQTRGSRLDPSIPADKDLARYLPDGVQRRLNCRYRSSKAKRISTSTCHASGDGLWDLIIQHRKLVSILLHRFS